MFFSKEVYERDEPALKAALQGERMEVVVPFGPDYFRVTTLPVKGEGGEVICGLVMSQNITKLKRTELELKKALEQLQLSVESAKLAIWHYDLTNDHLDYNSKMLELYGYEKEAFDRLAAPLLATVHPDDRWLMEEHIEKVKTGEDVFDLVFRTLLPNGQIRYINSSMNAVYDENEVIIGFNGVDIDITQIKENEAILSEREAFLRVIFDNSTNAILVVDDAGRFRISNRAAQEIFGYPEEQFATMNVAEMIGVDLDELEGQHQNYSKEGREIGERIIKRPDGEERIVEYHAVRVKDDFNLSIIVDITARKDAEKRLRESEDKFSKAFHSNPSAMELIDISTGKRIDVNDSFCELFGFPKEELIGVSAFEHDLWKNNDARERSIGELKKKGFVRNYPAEFTTKDGERISILGSAALLNLGKGPIVIASFVDITARKNIEAKLRESEEKFSKAFHRNPSAMIIHDIDNDIRLDVNESFSKLMGYSREELVGTSTLAPSLWARDEDRDKVIGEALESGALEYVPLLGKNKAGNQINVLCSSARLNLNKGNVFISSFIDVTDRLRAEQALRNSEERFRSVFNQQFQFMSILSKDGRVLEINDLPLIATGWSRKDFIGKPFWEAPPWRNIEGWPETLKKSIFKAIETNEAVLVEDKFQTIDGEIRYASASYSTVKDGSGQLQYILVQATDITERKYAEEGLKKAQKELSIITERLQASTQAAKVGVWDWDVLNKRIIWDDTMYILYDIEKEQASPEDNLWEHRILPEDRETTLELAYAALEGNEEFNTEFRIEWKDKSIHYIKAMGAVQRDAEGNAVRMIGTNWDITQEKEAERERLRASQLELKNKELEQFAYAASHDLQEPLRTIKSFVGLLNKRYKGQLDENANQYLEYISKASGRMSQLLQGLLEYSRLGSNKKLSSVDCTQLVGSTLEDLDAQITTASAKVEIHPLPVLEGFEVELRILFQNLISNAIKFSKKGVTPEIEISAKKEKDHWLFRVSDNGIGIPAMNKERIFVIFQRLHLRDEYEGTGIGLAQCQRIVDMHGGKIWVESEPDEGSSFFFTIPQQLS